MNTQQMVQEELATISLPTLHLSELETSFDNIVRQFFTGKLAQWVWKPHAEMVQEGEDVTIIADLPGVMLEDVKVEVLDNQLTISATRSSKEERTGGIVTMSDVRYGEFRRTFNFNFTLEPSQVEANLAYGVLEVKLKNAPQSLTPLAIPVRQRETLEVSIPVSETEGDLVDE